MVSFYTLHTMGASYLFPILLVSTISRSIEQLFLCGLRSNTKKKNQVLKHLRPILRAEFILWVEQDLVQKFCLPVLNASLRKKALKIKKSENSFILITETKQVIELIKQRCLHHRWLFSVQTSDHHKCRQASTYRIHTRWGPALVLP